ncbi:ATP-binding protein [Quadrisphaera sp. INWT6]|uniref:ATP-binding protein n=1 Tax=Quadrisphaera sp. INWT6 TaxID=2596917 RepID=UPI001891FA03|nr:ATP-binding protein [Quadrisphaera sp. INWT6]
MPVTVEVPASTLRCLRVRHEPAEVSAVRRALREDLRRDPRAETVADDVAVVTSELVGNAVRHGAPLDGGLLVRWGVGDEGVVVEVVDGGGPSGPGERQPVEAHDADPLATCGRGLRIVEELSRRWGTSLDADGRRTVWAVVDGAVPAVA